MRRLVRGGAGAAEEVGDAGAVVSEPWSSPGPANAATSAGTEKKEHALLTDLPLVEGTPR